MKFKKGLTLSKEELELVGVDVEFLVNRPLRRGVTSERAKILQGIQKKIEESKNK